MVKKNIKSTFFPVLVKPSSHLIFFVYHSTSLVFTCFYLYDLSYKHLNLRLITMKKIAIIPSLFFLVSSSTIASPLFSVDINFNSHSFNSTLSQESDTYYIETNLIDDTRDKSLLITGSGTIDDFVLNISRTNCRESTHIQLKNDSFQLCNAQIIINKH